MKVDSQDLTGRSRNWLKKLQSTSISIEVQNLLDGQAVEIGYRSSCSTTHSTMKTFEIFRNFLKALKAQGIEITETPVKHGNAYAGNNDGFWNSYIFEIKQL